MQSPPLFLSTPLYKSMQVNLHLILSVTIFKVLGTFMPSVSTLLTFHYLFARHKDSNIAFMTKICFLGISIGTFALMLTLIITNGFEKVISEKMQGINAPIIISSPGNKLNYHDIRNALLTDYTTLLAGVSGTTVKQAIIDCNNQQTVIFLKGIDFEHEAEVTTLPEKIITSNSLSHKNLSEFLQGPNILIGHKMAQEYHLQEGQQITLLIPEASGKRRIALKKQNVTICGIFKIGLEEYDNNFGFVSLDWLNKAFDDEGVDAITIKPKEPFQNYSLWQLIKNIFTRHNYEDEVLNTLKQRLPHLTVHSWKDLYPALVSSLKLEKYVMFFILALITLVASMNMISLLFMQIQQKRRDIAILKVMGLSQYEISKIFLKLGLTITFLASTLGLALAFAVGFILQHYPYIELPDVYYISYLPARIDGEIFIVVFVATMILGFLATWFPARRAQRISIAQVLRHE